MIYKEIHWSHQEMESRQALSGLEETLIKEARSNLSRAYAPYSHFPVSCAVLLDNGKIVSGTNQENAVYPLGLCAERVALFAASHQYPDVPFRALAVTTAKPGKAAFPCGSCRQVIAEYEGKFDQPIKLFIMGEGETYILPGVGDLLPFAFDVRQLKG